MSTLPGMPSFLKRFKFRHLLPVMLVLAAMVWIAGNRPGQNKSKEEDQIIINAIKFRELLSLIHTDYIDKTDTDSLADAALTTLIEELDPHSVYIPKKEVFEGTTQLESQFEGIGAEFQFIEDTIWVSALTEDSPSEKAGLQIGDKILKVNRIPISGVNISHQEITSLVRGPKGSQCMLEILRKGEKGKITVPVVRDKIRSKSLDYAGFAENGVGYIKCSRFTQNTGAEMREALIELLSRGMKSLVLDLRDNQGGYVSAAVKVADEFLAENQLIVFTEGRNPEHNSRTLAGAAGLFESGNLVVLINENTASAAEIVTGALQDNDRALVVGRRSFGKGLVQAPITLTDGSVVRLTISRYFSPSGRCIQKGYQRRKRQAYFKETESRPAMAVRDTMKLKGRPFFRTRLGRKVPGGGGIIPDIALSRDSILQDEKVNRRVDKPVLYSFLLRYFNDHKSELKKLGIQGFADGFEFNDKTNRELLTHLQNYGTEMPEGEFIKMKPALNQYMKAGLARCIWPEEGFFRVMQNQDREMKRALSLAPKSKKTLEHLAALKNKEFKNSD